MSILYFIPFKFLMKFILFFVILLLNFSSYAAMNVKLPRGGSKNIKFSKDIDMCTSLYNTIDFICGQSNIFINIKDTNNSDRIVVIFKNGTQELINVSREISEATSIKKKSYENFK
jgi:hypothetical protein